MNASVLAVRNHMFVKSQTFSNTRMSVKVRGITAGNKSTRAAMKE